MKPRGVALGPLDPDEGPLAGREPDRSPPSAPAPGGVAPRAVSALGATGRLAVGFVRVLRGAGLAVPLSALLAFERALRALGPSDPAACYWAGRATLCVHYEEIEGYDRCFVAFFGGRAVAPLDALALVAPVVEEVTVAGGADSSGEPGGEQAPAPALARYSAEEVLRRRDFAHLSEAERAEAAALLARLRFATPHRRSRRLAPFRHRSRRPDLHEVVRQAVRRDGELRPDRYLKAVARPRRLVVLLDVSGSMAPYARELLRFAQLAVARGGRVEAFALGTRCTRLTRQLAEGEADRALRAAVASIPDLAGGTRLGACLGYFNEHFGVRGLARGAVVVICSDGIDRGEPELLAEQLERLGRVAHLVFWVNPLKASPGYAPLTRGMAAALAHVDRFEEGHSVGALEALAGLVGAAR